MKTLIIIISIFTYNILYLLYYIKIRSPEKLLFYDYLKRFLIIKIVFIISCIFIIYIFKSKESIIWEMLNLDNVCYAIIHFLTFLSLFLSSTVRYIKSPTFILFENIQKKEKTYDQLVKIFIKKKLIKTRISDLKKQKIIKEKKGIIMLNKKFLLIIEVLNIIKKTLKLKIEG